MLNSLKRVNPPTERCKLLKEKILDVIEPVISIDTWGWHNDTVSLYYHPQYNSVFLYSRRGRLEELSKKETKWLVVQAGKVVSGIEERKAQDLIEKLRAL